MSQVFAFQDHPVRTITENGQTWFVGKDIATLLGYTKTDKEIRRICKHVKLFKGTKLVPLGNSPRGFLIIPEADVWRLIVHSTLPKAQEVEEWIMSEVLPTIHKTGKYEAKPKPKTKALTAAPEPFDHDPMLKAIAATVRMLKDQTLDLYGVLDRQMRTSGKFRYGNCASGIALTAHREMEYLHRSLDDLVDAMQANTRLVALVAAL